MKNITLRNLKMVKAGLCCSINNQEIELYTNSGSAYDPVTKKNKLKTEKVGTFYGTKSPITESRQQSMFGQIGIAETAFRFFHVIPEGVSHAIHDGRKFEVASSRNYLQDSVVYLKEVSEW